MKSHSVPNPAVRRLSLYLRQLECLAAEGVRDVSSRQLAKGLHLTAAQVRKDLGYFGQFGRRGVGYRIAPLVAKLRRILGTDKIRKIILVGAGDLGSAILRHKGFRKRGFEVVAAFDILAGKIGRRIGSVPVYHMDRLQVVLRRYGKSIRLAIMTVPASSAQEVTNTLCQAGITGILNFAPMTLETPDGIIVGPVDLTAHLEQLAFQVGNMA